LNLVCKGNPIILLAHTFATAVMPKTRSDRSPSPTIELCPPSGDRRDQNMVLPDRASQLEQDSKPAALTSTPVLGIPPPEPFSDGAENLRAFLGQCKRTFKLYPSSFEVEERKVLWASSYLRGPARQWFQSIDERDDDPRTTDFALFSQALTELYGTPVSVRVNACKLTDLRQTSTVAKYAAEFDALAYNLTWGDGGYRDQFYMGLKENIKDLLMEIGYDTMSFAELKSLAIQKDQMLQKRKSERALARAAPTGMTSSDELSRGPENYSGIFRRRGLPESERARRRREGLCHYCGASEHQVDNCPSRSRIKRPRLAATAESGNVQPQ
jgi:Retrotransposon gag protein